MKDPNEIEKHWRTLVEQPLIAGPWVPVAPRDVYIKGMYRYNHIGQPLAMATSQSEIATEDTRLEKLGYSLTDKDKQIPLEWWDSSDKWWDSSDKMRS